MSISLIGGNIYVPAEEIAQLLGMSVNWVEETGSLYIENQPLNPVTPQNTSESVRLSSLDYLAQSSRAWTLSDSFQINTGDFFSDCILVDTGGWGVTLHTRDYLINGQYSTIQGNIFLSYRSRSVEGENFFWIWGDDRLLYKSENVRAGFLPQAFEVDITGVQVLRIGLGNEQSAQPGFGISGVTLFN